MENNSICPKCGKEIYPEGRNDNDYRKYKLNDPKKNAKIIRKLKFNGGISR